MNQMKKEVTSFLKGDSKEIVEKIKEEMQQASDAMNYEKALELKTMLEDIDITLRRAKDRFKQRISV